MSSPVVIVSYDPAWPRRFEQEERLIRAAVGERLLGIEHVGSTAVPGLAAKPVVDVLAGVKDEAAADECLPLLAGIGFTDVTPCPEYPDWYYCVGKGSKPHDVHLHLCQDQGSFWHRHLLFRDLLRARPDVAGRYAELKHRLAGAFGSNRQGYCDAKTGFIRWVEALGRGIEIRRMEAADIPESRARSHAGVRSGSSTRSTLTSSVEG